MITNRNTCVLLAALMVVDDVGEFQRTNFARVVRGGVQIADCVRG
jgi:hypothetical protein